ncbi:DNA methyltransferase [Brachyspira catarrhinii]|uniref:site-specific DNA-methyltransferase (adenine-specific) n=1 Tax=Brachyspira catarrhinii TaxID=2528966 RepID=A0ABY2TRD8_9SPIR|nr:site-specific DNA-methyltransferase [Brachyspira catarrhinii]TKZ35158.1 site-specific DNA-methyltransferase [Brachyspira catarrhinii]
MKDNIIFEADNLEALKELINMGLEEKIDVIPIDPPYNTNIDYINYIDSFEGDSFISFMNMRIELAYKLLSPNGVMFIHIDDNEVFNLNILCKKIFGIENVKLIIWKKNEEIFDFNKKEYKKVHNINVIHEYVIVCFKNFNSTNLNYIKQLKLDNSGKLIESYAPLTSILEFLGSNFSAKEELYEIFDGKEVFRTPKPVKLIKEFIRSASSKNSLVLDFFAGSGTTGQACMELNKEDNGNRKFILVNNIENNICKTVLIPRINKVIEKFGFNETFRFISLY